MDKLELYVPKLDELWFRQKMMSDAETMSYNANLDMDYDGYHRDSGCIDFPKEKWEEWYKNWINNEPERFYAYIKRTFDDVWIGEISFHHTPEDNWWDMGIVIYAPYRGNGYSVPALRLLINHAFCDCGINRLHNNFEDTRRAALKAHLDVGFKEMFVENGICHLTCTKEE